MRAAIANGANLWNGGEFYGPMNANSLVLLERYFAKYPEDADKVVLSVKGAMGDQTKPIKGDGSEKEVSRSIENSIAQLKGRKKLDMFQCARRDPNTPLTETFGTMQKYIDQGVLGGISLSEVSAATIHEAAKITRIVAVEVEFSLWATDPLTNGVAAACAQYNIPMIAYSPISRGVSSTTTTPVWETSTYSLKKHDRSNRLIAQFLSGEIKSLDDIPEGDVRHYYPRFAPENFDDNLKLVSQVKELANKKGCTPSQLALSWVRSLSGRPGMPVIIPIPGSTTAGHVEENCKHIELSDAEMDEINEVISRLEIKGARSGPHVPINT